MEIEVTSLRTGEKVRLDAYTIDEGERKVLAATHRTLDLAYTNMPDGLRPSFTIEPFDVSKMPGIPPMFAVKCVMQKDDVRIEQIGELLCSDWENKPIISRQFPLTMCKNQAFDRAFIRYMQFDVSMYDTAAVLYSSSEIDIPKDATFQMTDKTLGTASAEYSVPCNDWTGDEKQQAADASSANAANGQAAVLSVQKSNGIAVILTNIGNIRFDARTNNFINDGTIDLNMIDLNSLYSQASNYVRMDLRQFALTA